MTNETYWSYLLDSGLVPNELDVKQTIKKLIEDNESVLTQNIVRFGVQREIRHVTTSTLTPPVGYFYVAAYVNGYQVRKKGNMVNDLFGLPKETLYRVSLSVVDYIYGIENEAQLYEQMDGDFGVLTDRMVRLIDAQEYFQGTVGRYRMDEFGTIDKQNTPSFWMEAEAYNAVCYCDINFNLVSC